jgi:hypothetical protein
MNITQVYLTPDYDTTEDRKYLSQYQNETTYIQLFIEECLRKNKVDMGAFNRLVFSEGGDPDRDFNVVGNNALPVAISKTYSELEALKCEREIHDYYIRKFLEGFYKFDKHYKSSFVSYLNPLLAVKYEGNLNYEKQMASNRVGGYRIQVVGRYERRKYKLLANVYGKKELLKSVPIFECNPDMFIVKYEAHKVDINDHSIVVTNKIRGKTLEREIAEII